MKLGLDVRHGMGKTVCVMQNSLTFASASGLTSYQALPLELHDNGWPGRSLKGQMKKISTVIIGSLIAIAVHAETVYPIGVGVHNTVDVIAPSTGNRYDNLHSESLRLWDANYITSVTLQPFINVFQNGVLLPQQPVGFIIFKWDGDTLYPNQIRVMNFDAPMTFQTQTMYWNTDGGYFAEEAIPVEFSVQLTDDEHFNPSEQYLQTLTSPQTWSYGFDVLSYETASVPEPTTLLLLAGGLVVFGWLKFKPARLP